MFREYAAMPGDSTRDVWCKIAMSEGYARIAGGQACHPVLNLFEQLKRADGGYLGDETNRILNERKNNRG